MKKLTERQRQAIEATLIDSSIVRKIQDVVDMTRQYGDYIYTATTPMSDAEQQYIMDEDTCDLVTWAEGGHTYAARFIATATATMYWGTPILLRDDQLTSIGVIEASLGRIKDAKTTLKRMQGVM